MTEAPLTYSRIEIEGCLPAGWVQEDDGEWSTSQGTWRVTVRDGADQDWRLEVASTSARDLGRLRALQTAVDRLYREALG